MGIVKGVCTGLFGVFGALISAAVISTVHDDLKEKARIKELNLEIQRMKQRECLDMMSAEIAELQFNDKVRKVLKEVAKKQYIKKYGKKSPGLS